jgi:cobaltochelatase CobT
MLERRYGKMNLADVSDRADAPLEEAVALLVREKVTGLAPPPSAENMVGLWRDWIEQKAGTDISRLGDLIEDQEAFAEVMRDLIASLDMADELGSDSTEEETETDDNEDASDTGDDPNEGADEDGSDSETSESAEADSGEEEIEQDATEITADDLTGEVDQVEGEEIDQPYRPPYPISNTLDDSYTVFTTAFDETVARRRAVRHRRARTPARLSRQAIEQSARRGGTACQQAAAPPSGAAEPGLGVRYRGRHARCRTPAAHCHRPDAAARLQA